MTPRVSVIIPNYNHYQYLRKRIESVLQQTFTDFELIILDDKSPDRSLEVINEFANNPHVTHIVFNATNSGSTFRQWKRGIDLTRGEWIWIAESDDYAEVNFLEKMVAAAERNPNAGLLYCDARIITNGELMSETFADVKNKVFNNMRWSNDYVNNGKREIEDYLLAEGTINNTSAVLFNARVLKAMDPFDINFRYIGDKYAYIRVMAISDIVYLKDRLSYYRDPFNTKHGGKFIHYVHEQFKVFDWVYKNMKDVDKKKFFHAFFQNTSCSLVRNWNIEKANIFVSIFSINTWLFIRWILWNFVRPFKTRLRKDYYAKRSNIPV